MTTTLYRFYDEADKLLYVGIAGNPGRRFNQHSKQKLWWDKVMRSTMEHFEDRDSALIAEQNAIKGELPSFNKVHRISQLETDKAFARLVLAHWRDLTVTDVSVFCLLLQRVGQDRLVKATQGRLATRLGTTRQVVSRSLKRLINLGWIERLEADQFLIDVELGWTGQSDDRFQLAADQRKLPKGRGLRVVKPSDED